MSNSSATELKQSCLARTRRMGPRPVRGHCLYERARVQDALARNAEALFRTTSLNPTGQRRLACHSEDRRTNLCGRTARYFDVGRQGSDAQTHRARFLDYGEFTRPALATSLCSVDRKKRAGSRLRRSDTHPDHGRLARRTRDRLGLTTQSPTSLQSGRVEPNGSGQPSRNV